MTNRIKAFLEPQPRRHANIVDVGQHNIEEEVLNHQGDVLLDFHAEWCAPCRRMRPVLEQVAQAGVKVAQVDINEHPELASYFNISGLPSFVAVRNGEAIQGMTGVQTARQLLSVFGR